MSERERMEFINAAMCHKTLYCDSLLMFFCDTVLQYWSQRPLLQKNIQSIHFLFSMFTFSWYQTEKSSKFFNSSMQYQQISRFYFLDKSLKQLCEVYHNCCQLTSRCLTDRLTLSAQYFKSYLELFASFCLLTHLNVLLCGLICTSLYQLPVTVWNWKHFRKHMNQNLHLCL